MMAEAAIEAMRQAQEESAWAACHDPLTGLGNRKLLEEISSASVSDEAGGTFAIAIDLNRFKDINDSFGHEAGDLVLKATAQHLLRRTVEGRDFTFRVGGDEFVLLIDRSQMAGDPQQLCNGLVDQLREPVNYKGVELRAGASVGFAISDDQTPLGQALRYADLALCEAKAQGRNRAQVYSATIGATYDKKLQLANDLKAALENGDITVDSMVGEGTTFYLRLPASSTFDRNQAANDSVSCQNAYA